MTIYFVTVQVSLTLDADPNVKNVIQVGYRDAIEFFVYDFENFQTGFPRMS